MVSSVSNIKGYLIITGFYRVKWLYVSCQSRFVKLRSDLLIWEIQSIHSMFNCTEECSWLEQFFIIVNVKVRVVNDAYSTLIFNRNSNDNCDKVQFTAYKILCAIKRINPYSGIFCVKCLEIFINLDFTCLSTITFNSCYQFFSFLMPLCHLFPADPLFAMVRSKQLRW